MGDRRAAVDFYNQAVKSANDKSKPSNLTTAFQLFSAACYADPTWGESWYQTGNNLFDLNRSNQPHVDYNVALAAYRRALQCELPKDTKSRLLLNMSWAWHELGNFDEALSCTNEALNRDASLTQAWMHLSTLAWFQHDTKKAVTAGYSSVECAENDIANGCMTDAETFGKLQGQLLEAKMALAFSLLHDGQYAKGFEWFENRFEWRLHQFLQMPYPKWHGEPDKVVFLASDQGLGDTLVFARFVEAACKRAKYVHAYIHCELQRLFMFSLGHIPNLNIVPLGAPFPSADAWTTFVSLPYALKLTDDEIRSAPQISYSPESLPNTWKVPDAKLHIGIAWAGSPLNDIDKFRNVPITQFLDLYQVPGIQLYGLQVGEKAKELLDTGCVGLIRDLSPYIRDVTSTLALLRNLDLVICVESALGHICALAGKECWVPLSFWGIDYRYGTDGKRLLWMPKHRTFKQGKDGKWGPVFDEIVKALRERVDGIDRKAGKGGEKARATALVER